MRKQQSAGDIKLLHKKYKFFDQPNLRVLYEYCDEDYERTEKILMVAKDIKNPKSIVKMLLEKPERGHALLASLEKRADDLLKLKREAESKQGNQEDLTKEMEGRLNFFRYIPEDVNLIIYLFLDPYSAARLSETSRKLIRVYNSPAFSEYYKRLCINLFDKREPTLPNPSRFLPVKNYVLKNAKVLGPNVHHAVVTNLRKFIWGSDITLKKQPVAYFQSFGGFKELFLNAPRINFNGFYLWKQQHRKEEDKNLLSNLGNVHFIKYYRYLRFFEDGSVISAILPSRQKYDQIEQYLSKKNLELAAEEEDRWKEIMVGEFIANRDEVRVKIGKSESIFTYELKITQQQGSKHAVLTLLTYNLKVISSNQIIQTLEQFDSERPKYFSYFPHFKLRAENYSLVRSSSL